MNTVIVSSKGQMIIPKELRDRLGIDSGDELVLSASAGGFTASVSRPFKKHKFKTDKKTGFPMFDANAPRVTREQIEAVLEDLP